MYLHPNWNILTVGDGDLSFSRSLAEDHGHHKLVVSTLDNANQLNTKYPSNEMDWLNQAAIPIHHQVDVSDPTSFPISLANKFDLVIFQFPLVPAFKSKHDYEETKGASSNLLNRILIVNFIDHCVTHLLAPNGPNLCYITSKDVKPYADWNLENLGPLQGGMKFVGQMDFVIEQFPQYRIRNVNRDKQLKHTKAFTGVWSNKDVAAVTAVLQKSPKHLVDHCALCGNGPFAKQEALKQHNCTKSHVRKAGYEERWQNLIRDKINHD